MIAVLILCIVTLVFVIVNTVLVATLHRLNLKLASKHVKEPGKENISAPNVAEAEDSGRKESANE